MLTFSPLFFEFSFSFFLREVMKSVKIASLSFIFSIALKRASLACLAANSLKVVLRKKCKKKKEMKNPCVLKKIIFTPYINVCTETQFSLLWFIIILLEQYVIPLYTCIWSRDVRMNSNKWLTICGYSSIWMLTIRVFITST